MGGLWSPEQPRARYLCCAVLGISIGAAGIVAMPVASALLHPAPDRLILANDFAALWSTAKVAVRYPVPELYDDVLLHERQVETGLAARGTYPFPYPPWFVFALLPLVAMGLTTAYIVVGLAGLAAFAMAIRRCSRSSWVFGIAGCVLPASAGVLMTGQLGLLHAAAALTGLRLADTAPRIAGILIGLLAFKPQLGLIIPVALLAAGCWRTLAWAAGTVTVLAVAATAAFGFSVWHAWLGMLPNYAATFDGMETLRAASPTVLAMARSLGGAPWLADAAQTVATTAVAAVVFLRCHGPWDADKCAIALVGSVLAAPHALFYDLPLVTAGMLLFATNRLRERGGLTGWEVTILVVVALVPMQYVMPVRSMPILPLCLAALFWTVARPARVSAPAPG